MRKIYSFSDFSSLYEADAVTPTEASKLYDQTLGLILTTALNAYTSELDFPIASYDANIDADVAAIKSTPVLDKPNALKTIMAKVQKAAADNKSEGAKEAIDAWVAAGAKAVDALTALINQYKDQPEELKHINDSINSKVDEFLENLIDSSKDNTLKADVIAAKESYEFEGAEEISEAMDWLKGKKGMIEDVAKQITLVSAKLANLAETPGMASSVTKLQAEVSKIAAEMGALLDKKNSEINKEDIKKAAARLAEIPTEADKMAEKMLKQDATNKEASSILVQAFGLVQIAKNLEKEYLAKKEEAKQKETAAKIKVSLTVPTVDYTPEETKNVNPEVKKFQELVVDKFGKIKAISSLPQYTKMGTDGKFGPNTRDIVKILKKGFDLQDSSGDITKELVDEIQIQADTIKESNNSRIFKFSDFVNISEAAFNLTAAVDTAKALPTYKPASTGSGASSKTAAKAEVKKEEVKKEEAKKEDTSLKQALTNGEIQTIAKELIDASGGTTDEASFLSAIEKLKNKKDFQILNSLISRSYDAQRYQDYKKISEMGLSSGSTYVNLAAMINGEMGSDDTGTVRLIKDHLKKIGVDANYSSAKNGEFIEDSFTIK
jgi:hypothetical protein